MSAVVILRAYPDGLPAPEHFTLVDMPAHEPGDGEVLVAVSHLSMDPFPRLRMRADSRVGPPLRLGAVVEGRGVGHVAVSRHPDFTPGNLVAGELGWRAEAVLPGAALTRLDPALGAPERHLSLVGPSGMTAYFAMAMLEPRPRATVVIAPAAGSVGVVAGQIARNAGARVVGIVSGAAQGATLVDRLGFAAAVHHADPDALAAACPDGIDLFLDGVGGALHDAVLPRLNLRARVVLLGFISAYNDAGPPRYGQAAPVLFKRARVEGFLLADWADRFGEALGALAAWAREGRIQPVETIWRGLERAPEAFAALFGDAPPGKQIVAVRGE